MVAPNKASETTATSTPPALPDGLAPASLPQDGDRKESVGSSGTDASHASTSPRLDSKNTYVFPIRSVFDGAHQTTSDEPATQPVASPPATSPRADDLTTSIHDMLEHPERLRTFALSSPGAASATLSHTRAPNVSDERHTVSLSTIEQAAQEADQPQPEIAPDVGANVGADADADGTGLVRDFAGLVRLGATQADTLVQDGPSGLSGATADGPPPTHARSSNKLRLGSGQAQMRAQTRKSVRDFVLDQAKTVHVEDPNAAAPSPVPEPGHTPKAPSGSKPAAARGSSNVDGVPLDVPQPQASRSRPAWMDQSSDSEEVRLQASDRSNSMSDFGKGTSGRTGGLLSESGYIAEEQITTNRFEYISTEDNHHILIGREQKFLRCQDEPITTPGAVQGFGVLILLEEDVETGKLRVRQVSENSTELLGLSPRYLFRLQCFTHILTREEEGILRDNIENIVVPEGGTTSEFNANNDGPTVFQLSGFGEPGSDDSWDRRTEDTSESHRRREWSCWVAATRPRTNMWKRVDENGNPLPSPELIILELELEDDEYNPLVHPPDFSDSITPDSESVLASDSAPPFAGGLNPPTGSRGSMDSKSPRSPLGSVDADRRGSRGDSANGSQEGEFDSQGGASQSGSNPQVRSGSTQPSERQTPSLSASAPSRSSRSTRSTRSGVDGIEVAHPLETILESTTNHAKPLRALMRRDSFQSSPWSQAPSSQDAYSSARGSGVTSSSRPRRTESRRTESSQSTTGSVEPPMDVFAVLNQMNAQLTKAKDLPTFLKIAVGLVKQVCRFHRVLMYKFDEEWNGKVVEELVDWEATNDLFKGLLFPASDIPPQARELYKIDRVRFLYDRSQLTARMVLRDKEDLDYPLDMSNCFLRAMSPIHLRYLANMGVRSSMSVSVHAFGKLWGLIACHSYGENGMRVAFPVRQMLRLLSDLISRHVERLSYAERIHTRKLIQTHGLSRLHDINPPGHRGSEELSQSSSSYMISNADELLHIFDADAGMLVINDGCKLLGQNDQAHTMLAIAEYLRIVKFNSIKATNSIAKDIPALSLPRADDTIAGLLYVPLSSEAPGRDFIVFLRKGQVHEVKWAGKPYKTKVADASATLEPRKSFKIWRELMVGKARSWTEDQIDSAGVLGLVYGKFISVWRERQGAIASNQLTAILLSNTSHAVRTPLSQVINTLEMALAGDIDADTRSMLENSHQASRALLFHVHDLLDLTRIETGNQTSFNDPFDLKLSIDSTVRLYQTEATRRGIDFSVTLGDDLPPMVIGDSSKLKTLVSNLVANAVKYTTGGRIEVECHLEPGVLPKPGTANIEIVVRDTGCGIPAEKLEAMFVTLEGAEDSNKSGGVGLGLAVVARIVEQCEGQLRAESEVGVGTTFSFVVNLRVHGDFMPIAALDNGSTRASSPLLGAGVAGASSLNGARVSLNRQQQAGSEKRKLIRMDGGETPSTTVAPSVVEAETAGSRTPAPGSPAISVPSVKPPLRQKIGPDGKANLRLLVVEDDPVNMKILTRRLKLDNHTVLQAENGQVAVDLLREDWDVDAVIMDIQMPIMNGYESAEAIRAMQVDLELSPDISPVRINDHIPVFALSASLYESDREKLSQNFDGWLLKPLNIGRLRSILRGLMDMEARNGDLYKPGQWEAGGYFPASFGEAKLA